MSGGGRPIQPVARFSMARHLLREFRTGTQFEMFDSSQRSIFAMKKFASIATVLVMAAGFCLADTFTGKLVDAACKAGNQGKDVSAVANCAATADTHLFAIELPDAKILNLDSAGNEKATDAIKKSQKTALRATVTGSLDGQTLKVQTIELQ
jgi:diaminopimelate decarboxylase